MSHFTPQSSQIMSELSAVEGTLDQLLTTSPGGSSTLSTRKAMSSSAQSSLPPPSSLDEADGLAPDLQRTNDVTFDERFPSSSTSTGYSSNNNGSSTATAVGRGGGQPSGPAGQLPSLVFPSVRNKPSAEAGGLDAADALLTGV
jgi:hypothetical protein